MKYGARSEKCLCYNKGQKVQGHEISISVESVMMETDKNIYFDKQNNNMATSIMPTQERQSVSK